MFIKSFSCSRFAGLKERNIEFEKGMNVILGPNESGKITLVEGIYPTLFKDPKLRMIQRVIENFMKDLCHIRMEMP